MQDAPEPSMLPTVSRNRELLRMAAPAVVFLAVRAIGLLILWLMAWVRGTDPIKELSSYDGAWLVDIAEHGYTGLDPATHLDAFGNYNHETPYGFFPGYPFAVSMLRPLGFDKVTAGLVVSLVAGVVTAYALVRLAELIPGGSRRAGLIFVALFASAPMAIALSMTYTEALFCALAAWALVHLLRERWMAAGACCMFAGLVRPTAFALIAAFLLAAGGATRRGSDHWQRALAAALLAPVGLAGYLIYVVTQTGSRDGWFGVQERGWGWSFDFGIGALDEIGSILTTDLRLFDAVQAGTIIACLAMLGVSIHRRIPWPLVVYAAGVVAMTLGVSGVITTTRARYLIPAFIIFLPIAIGLANRKTGTVWVALMAIVLVSAWFGGYALVSFRTAI
jgi:hypothetical protein